MTLATSRATPTSPADFTLHVSNTLTTDVEFIGVRASVESRGFSGVTTFTIARRDMQRFLGDAADVRDGSAALVVLLGGWNDREEYLRLQIARPRASSQFVVRVRMATPGLRANHWSRVDTEFVVDHDGFGAFLDELTRFAMTTEVASASLRGIAEAIV